MQINEIRVQGFGIIKDEVVVTPAEGINLISGINGSGKSTMYKAVILMLFNKTDKKLEEYINENLPLSEGFSMSMDFMHHKQRYVIEYAFSRSGKTGKSDRKLYVGDPKPDDPQYLNSDAVEYLESVLQPTLGLAGLISRQGENDAVTAKPAERREHFKEIYDLDFTEEIESLEADLEEYDKKIIPEIEKRIYAVESRDYTPEELQELPFDEDRKKEIESKIDEARIELRDLEKHQEEVEKHTELIREAKRSMTSWCEKADQYRTRREDIERRRDKAVEKLESLNLAKVEELEAELEDSSEYEAKKADIEDKLTDIKVKRIRKFDEDDLNRAIQDKAKLKADLDAAHDKMHLCEEGSCPTCGRPFDGADIDKIQDEIDLLDGHLNSAKEEVKRLRAEKSEHEEAKKERDEKLNERNLLQQKLDSLEESEKSRKQNLKKRIEEARESYEREKESLEERIAEYNEVYEETGRYLAEAVDEEAKLIKKITNLKDNAPEPPDEDRIETLEENIEKLNGHLERYAQIKAENEAAKKRNAEIEAKKEEDEKVLADLQTERDEKLRERADYEEARNIFRKEFPSYVINEMVNTMEEGINDFIDEVYYKSLDVEIRESRNSISITYGKVRKKDVAHLSGAEQQLVSLAYKNYLNRLMNLGVIFLDEVDAHYTDENAERLYDIIGNMADYYNQVFVVSHNEQAKSKLTQFGAAYFEFEDGQLVA